MPPENLHRILEHVTQTGKILKLNEAKENITACLATWTYLELRHCCKIEFKITGEKSAGCRNAK